MGKSITEIMEPHKDVLQDMIPPKKHLLRHQPANAQIGLMVSAHSLIIFHLHSDRPVLINISVTSYCVFSHLNMDVNWWDVYISLCICRRGILSVLHWSPGCLL